MTLRQRAERLLLAQRMEEAKIRALGPRGVPAMIEIFEQAEGPAQDSLCRRSLHALGVLGTRKAVDYLISVAENEEIASWLRRAAVRSVTTEPGGSGLAYLKSLLTHSRSGWRMSAVMALGRSGRPSARSALATVRDDDPDPHVRSAAATALGEEPLPEGPVREVIAD